MSTDTVIQMGMLAVAIITLVCAGVARTLFWRRNKYGVRFEVLELKRNFTYIFRVAANADSGFVDTVALPIRIRITNTSTEPFLLSDIEAHENDAAPRPLIALPCRDIHFTENKAVLESPVALPFTVNAGEGIALWLIAEASVPRSIGKVLFEVYGDKAKATDAFQHIKSRLANSSDLGDKLTSTEVNEKLTKAMGISIVKAAVHEIVIHLPIRPLTKEQHELQADLGLIPPTAVTEVLYRLNDGTYRSPLKTTTSAFHVSFLTGTGRKRRIALNAKNRALWFF